MVGKIITETCLTLRTSMTFTLDSVNLTFDTLTNDPLTTKTSLLFKQTNHPMKLEVSVSNGLEDT